MTDLVPSPPVETATEIGRRIGSYVLREIIGEGGMGTVYLAEHSVIGRKVAIKILRPELAGQKILVARFINESRARELVGHPGIVEVIDIGTLESGVPYLVMEYLQGESLAQRIAKVGQLPIKDAAGIAWQTASAVGAAHARGLIHRDLKPENLFLVRDPATPGVERVKVLDFGIAKLLAAPTQLSTQSGAVMGTPVYMSPEQCRGGGELDQRTDIYSLGIIVYEMLTGRPPFQGEAFGDLLMLHMTQAPAPIAAANPDVPRGLEAVVMRALAKPRDDRWPSMRELQNALATWTQGLSESTPTPAELTGARPVMMEGDGKSGTRGWMVGGAIALALGAAGLFLWPTNGPASAPVPRPARFVAPPVASPVAPPVAPPAPEISAAALPRTATLAPPAQAVPARGLARPAPAPSGKKRVPKQKIEVKQW